MTRIRYSAPVDPTDRFTQQIRSLQEQVAELQRAVSRAPANDARFGSLLASPSGDTTTTGVMTDWVTIGNLTVPAWATTALLTVAYTGVEELIGTTTNNLRLVVGTDVGTTVLKTGGPSFTASFFYIDGTLVDAVPLTSTGVKALKVQASRAGGAGAWRAGASSDFTAVVIYR